MKTFRANEEAKAQQNKAQYKVPDELLDEYIIDKTGWTYAELAATPFWRIERLMLYWHLVAEAQEAESNANKPKGKQGR